MDKIDFYAVTDQHVIIPLKIINRHEWDDATKVETEIADGNTSTPDGHMECHHRIYFRELWLDIDGLPDKSNVFLHREFAVAYALNKASEEIETKQSDINAIKETVAELISEGDYIRTENVVVICTAPDGSPAAPIFCVEVTANEYELGIHYDKAEAEALEESYEKPFTCFDNSEHGELIRTIATLEQLRK